jgi:glucokinase
MRPPSAASGASPSWIGLDLGGTKVFGVVLQGDEVAAEAKRKTPLEGGPEAVVETLAGVVDDLGGATGVEGIGIGAPGAIDEAAGVVRDAPNLPGFDGEVPLAGMLADRVGVPAQAVRIGNDVSVAVLAEHRLGAGQGVDDMLGVWCGTGVGGGLVLGGTLRRGPTGVAGEIGHTVVKIGGRRCRCGKRGHLEAYAGRGAMEAIAREQAANGHKTALVRIAGDKRMTSGVFAKALAEDDEVAVELIDGAVEALGAAVASAVTLVDVGLVVIGGGLGDKLGQPFCDRIKAAAAAEVFPGVRGFDVVPCAFPDRSGAIGAALLARAD